MKFEGPLYDTALRITNVLTRAGHVAYFAGGCVRDFIMGNPIADIDIATSAPPDEVEKLFPKTFPVGKQFGVIIVHIDDMDFEVATFRTDMAYSDGRRPDSVRFTNEKEDVLRRDFTINGLLYDPVKDKILDYVNGQKDIENKIIRTIGDPEKRFFEDKLRMIRAIRFATRFNFVIEDATKEAIKKLKNEITLVSAERIGEEISKILTGTNKHIALDLLDEVGLLAIILPEIKAMQNVAQPPEFHPEGDVYVHTRMMLEDSDTTDLELGLAILLHDIGKPPTFEITDRIRFNNHDTVGRKMAEEVMRRLKYSNETITKVCELIGAHMKFRHVPDMREAKLKRFILDPLFPKHLELHRIDCRASHGKLEIYELAKEKLDIWLKEKAELEKRKKLVTGDDLIKLGFKPGPKFKEILEFVEDAYLENKIQTKEEGIELIKNTFLTP